MGKIINDEPVSPEYGILHHKENVDLLPGNIELAAMEVTLVNAMSRETILREYIHMQSSHYDYILIDCMPSLGMLTINALTASDSVIIPVQPQYLPIKGLEQLLKTIFKVQRQLNRELTIDGILLTMVDERTNFSKDIIQLLIDSYGSKLRIFQSRIPFSVRATETSAEGISIYVHDPRGKVAASMRHLLRRLISYEEQCQKYSNDIT